MRVHGFLSRFCAHAVAITIALLAVGARAEEPLYVPWSSIFPALSPGYDPNSDNVCKKGQEACLHAVIREMYRRWQPLSDTCDHRVLFALSYLRTTEVYHEVWHEPGSFANPAFLNHYDAMFASYYFAASDAWAAGRLDEVPPAWRVAFSAAANREVSGQGDQFLGINAHINRDLPFVIYSIGLADSDGTSHKPDHDRVNEFLNRVADIVFPELARRYDPTVTDGRVEGTTLDDFLSFQIVPSWREMAWRNAEALANAPDDVARARVAQDIEDYAYGMALVMKGSTAYAPLSSSAARDAYCAIHHND